MLLKNHNSANELMHNSDALIPMPLSTVRLQERGYNQAQLLSQAFAPHKTRNGLLLRIRHTRPQSECSLTERLSNVRNAFAVEPAMLKQITDKRLLLIDDVMTTGASLFEAAHTLLHSGASHVSALVIARTLHD